MKIKEKLNLTATKTEKIEEEIDLPPPCDIISGKAFRNFEFKQNEQFKQQNGLFICIKCNQSYTKKERCRVHYRHHLNVAHPCLHCGKKFKTPRSYKNHLQQKHNVDIDAIKREKKTQGPITCEVCAKVYLTRRKYRSHFRDVHAPKRDQKCVTCGKIYSNRRSFGVHVRSHTGCVCTICGKRLATYSSLVVHRNGHDKQEECEWCHKKFSTREKVRQHVRARHTNERPFKCTFCDKRFPTHSMRSAHVVWHMNVRKYKCRICRKTFVRSYSLRRHIKNVHKVVNASDVDSFRVVCDDKESAETVKAESAE